MSGGNEQQLYVHVWGADGAPRVVFLHGVTGHGGHARVLAEDWLAESFQVLAPDLIGHGSSPYEPPWSIEDHLEAIVATVGESPADWIGHSFGGRLAVELAAHRPELVRRLVLLDPALYVPPPLALEAAEAGRPDRSYGSFDEAVDRRFDESRLHGAPRDLVVQELREHLFVDDDGRWRYRYSRASVVAAFGELASPPPPLEAARVPTLLVVGAHSYLPYDDLVTAYRGALGDLLEVRVVDGGHTLLWDALDATAEATVAFLSG